MTLSTEDGKLFYQLWLPLLTFVNREYHVNEKIKEAENAGANDPADIIEIANKLWTDIGIIDSYLKGNPQLPYEHKEIIRSWKRRVKGRFVLERHLKKGSIFISLENEEVYQVSGIVSSWEEMLFGAQMPTILETTFIPFRDVIISDGLIMPYNIVIGSGLRRSFKDIYMNAKRNNRIHQML